MPARRTTSHSVICRDMPPDACGVAAGAAPGATGCSAKPDAWVPLAAHCPSGPTRSAAVIGRSSKSLLPPEKVAQSGLVMTVLGLGASVTSVRLRLDEQAPNAEASAA